MNPRPESEVIHLSKSIVKNVVKFVTLGAVCLASSVVTLPILLVGVVLAAASDLIGGSD